MAEHDEDTGWTEEAREAARRAKEAMKGLLKSNEPEWHKEMREHSGTNIPWAEAAKQMTQATKEAFRSTTASREEHQAERLKHEQEWAKYYSDDYPYKSVEHNEKGAWITVGYHSSFAEAYTHPLGTHVMQTHGTSAELEQQIRGTASSAQSSGGEGSVGTAMATGAAAGWLVAGPLGAAVGALMGGSRPSKRESLYRLPNPVITPKPVKE